MLADLAELSSASSGPASGGSAESCGILQLPYSEPFEPQMYYNPAMLMVDEELLFVHTSLCVYHPPTGTAPRTQWNTAMESPSRAKYGHYLAAFRTRLHAGWGGQQKMLAASTSFLTASNNYSYTDVALPTLGLVEQVQHLGLPSLLHGANRTYDLDEMIDALRPCAHGTMLSEGPSDPRLFHFNGAVHMLFGAWECYPEPIHERAGRGNFYASQYLTPLHVHAQPMQETKRQRLVRSYGKSVRLIHPGAHRSHKNWMPWVYRHALQFSLFVEPHLVTTLESQHIALGCTMTVKPTYNTSHELLHSLQQTWGMLSGGTPAIKVQCGASESMYLAIIHAKRGKRYANFAVGFSQEPPFNVLRVSRVLPLLCKPRGQGIYGFNGSLPSAVSRICFPTGLQLAGRHLLISYGAGDAESRLWTIELSTFCTEFILSPEREHLLRDDLHEFLTHSE